MRRKLLILATAVGLLAALAPGASAATRQYNFPCDTGAPNNAQVYTHYEPSAGIEFASGLAPVRALRPCTSPTTSNNGGSAVMVVNIQQRPGATPGIVQIGYMQQHCPSGYICTVPDDGLQHVVYTCNDWSPILCVGPSLQTGNMYSWSIHMATDFLGNPTWQYQVDQCGAESLTSPLYACTPGSLWGSGPPRTWGITTGNPGETEGRSVWYGFETWNTHDAMGTTAPAGGIAYIRGPGWASCGDAGFPTYACPLYGIPNNPGTINGRPYYSMQFWPYTQQTYPALGYNTWGASTSLHQP